MESAPLPNNADREPRQLVLIVDSDLDVKRLVPNFDYVKAHFGAQSGYIGTIRNTRFAIALAEPNEGAAYAALRHLSHLFRPQFALQLASANALTEDLHAGDLALVENSRRVYVPPAIADNMFADDEVVFSSTEQREHVLNTQSFEADQPLLQQLRAAMQLGLSASLQSNAPTVHAGSMTEPIPAWRGAEFLQHHFQVDALDRTGYGFSHAAHDLSLCAATVLLITDGSSSNEAWEFRRSRGCHYRNAAEGLMKIVQTLVPLGGSHLAVGRD